MRRVALLVILSFSLNLILGCTEVGSQEKIKISVIVKTTDTDFWKAVQNGCNSAASEYNAELEFDGPDNEEDYQTQNQLIQQAIEQDVNAIVFSAIDSEKSVKAIEQAIERGIYVVVIDSGIHSRMPEVVVSTDNYGSGEEAAKAILNSEEEALKIGIVNFAKGTANGQEREQGFVNQIEKEANAEIVGKVYVDSNLRSAKEGTLQLFEQYPEINAVIAFNELTSIGAGDAIKEAKLTHEIRMIGFDNNRTSIELLEDGAIDGLLVQNQFAIGYLGVECAYNLVKHRYMKEREIYTDVTLIERENLFEEHIQKIVFPVDNTE